MILPKVKVEDTLKVVGALPSINESLKNSLDLFEAVLKNLDRRDFDDTNGLNYIYVKILQAQKDLNKLCPKAPINPREASINQTFIIDDAF